MMKATIFRLWMASLLTAGLLCLSSCKKNAVVWEGCPEGKRLSVEVPDGVYRVTVTLGSETQPGLTTVRGESRRLFLSDEATAAGQFRNVSFNVHKRTPAIGDSLSVRLKTRELGKLNWNNTIDLEFCGAAPQVNKVRICRADDVPVIFLCGNSTVVDQDNEPWASWGQMITFFFDDRVCVANFAESGEAANSFQSARRWQKILSMIKPGDYVFVEFGHNDEKQKGEGKGAYLSFWQSMEKFVTDARENGATPVLCTPTQRRRFDEEGHLVDTHMDFPQATRDLAAQDGVALVDLHAMTTALYEAWGVENSVRGFVHYPAGTWPGQDGPLADNTHFNPYGAFEVARCVAEGISQSLPQLAEYLKPEWRHFNPAEPDDWNGFVWYPSDFVEIQKPDGN